MFIKCSKQFNEKICSSAVTFCSAGRVLTMLPLEIAIFMTASPSTKMIFFYSGDGFNYQEFYREYN